jgi:hypothetical protein
MNAVAAVDSVDIQSRSLITMRDALTQYARDLLAFTIEERGIWNLDSAIDEVERQMQVKVEVAIEDALKVAYNERW